MKIEAKFDLFALGAFFVMDSLTRSLGLGSVPAVVLFMLFFMRPIEVPRWFRERFSGIKTSVKS